MLVAWSLLTNTPPKHFLYNDTRFLRQTDFFFLSFYYWLHITFNSVMSFGWHFPTLIFSSFYKFFDWIKIWWLSGPLKNINLFISSPFLSFMSHVFVMLKYTGMPHMFGADSDMSIQNIADKYLYNDVQYAYNGTKTKNWL